MYLLSSRNKQFSGSGKTSKQKNKYQNMGGALKRMCSVLMQGATQLWKLKEILLKLVSERIFTQKNNNLFIHNLKKKKKLPEDWMPIQSSYTFLQINLEQAKVC